MFRKNLPRLIDKGVILSGLFGSKLFSSGFDFDEWSSSHKDGSKYCRPYNESMFDLRYSYRLVFPEQRFEVNEEIQAIEEEANPDQF